ncbi:MAG: type II toxin-antitoxin system HicA family toxin [Anaerolineaceae bacterium]|nr:type II toxin-antitoxin system HicA family toxin [Anaerolineaceae bacterium]
MPRKGQKLLERARQNKAGWDSKDLIYLVESFGFELSSKKGSHHTYRHQELKHLRITIPHPKELAKPYVSEVVSMIDEVIQYQKGKRNG